jgi:hypothetical protein
VEKLGNVPSVPGFLGDGVIGVEAVDLLNESKGGTDFQY